MSLSSSSDMDEQIAMALSDPMEQAMSILTAEEAGSSLASQPKHVWNKLH
jgi:hypothetical protein